MRNGYIPQSWLKPLPGRNAGLLKGYAYSYIAMHYRSLKATGVSLAIYDGAVGRTYRSYARQVQAKRVYGRNAAYPGTSNHGLGRAVDLHSYAQRRAIDRIGYPYGWSKRTSDASHEWWHLRGIKQMGAPRPADPLKPLGARTRRACDRLLYHRREMAREKRSGQGPRYRRQLRWARFWKARVETLHARSSGKRRALLTRVLKATSGRL